MHMKHMQCTHARHKHGICAARGRQPTGTGAAGCAAHLQHGLGTRAERHEREAHEGACMARCAYHEAVSRTAEEAVAEGGLAWAAIVGRVSIVSGRV